ncbi:hypothetical protein T265_03871 [Opisthorchis viverrini]|uniref:Ribonuclease n=1 Tax=Opisthorchis viverrini TaxID=6198 RepID=A0A074ZUG9_OPIVI|nr:hypothetical protein T265_03871 [Opisthorchis viverrini]KER29492.1 hypothetical protein T265_03871 [Opisthorchis viverrini]
MNQLQPQCCTEPYMLGIDEAGRGPVLGPMVYACALSPISKSDDLKVLGLADSKTLTEHQRESLLARMLQHTDWLVGAVRVISPRFITEKMLGRCKTSLNVISHDAAIGLIRAALDKGVNVKEVYVDTVGKAELYEAKLQALFPELKICVESKADDTYAIVSAASIFAKTLMVDMDSRTNFTCRMIEEHPVAKFSVTFEVICTYTIPFCLVLVLNALIGFRLWQLKHERKHLFPKDYKNDRMEMGRVMGHLALTTAFLLLYMPVVCMVLIRLNVTLIRLDRHSPHALRIIDLSRLFSSVKDITYAVNFPLYLIFLRNFRHRFVLMFCPCRPSRRPNMSNQRNPRDLPNPVPITYRAE